MLTLFTAAAVLAACAGLRWFLNRPERKDAFFWGGRIRLTALWNDGAAFSLPLKRKLVTALSILILPLVWVFRRRSPIGAGLALGGGLSNLWERLRRGAVYDYVQFPKLPKIGRYVWNLADLAILIGGLLLTAGTEKMSNAARRIFLRTASACRKSLFAPLSKFSELYKSSENSGFQWRRTPFWGFPRTPFLTITEN